MIVGTNDTMCEMEEAIEREMRKVSLDLIKEMAGYLEPNEAGQINTIKTGSIFHDNMRRIVKLLK